jgi:hypothetical protein
MHLLYKRKCYTKNYQETTAHESLQVPHVRK